jgi:hypothetical protein
MRPGYHSGIVDASAHQLLNGQLLARFRTLQDKPPAWSWPFPPSCPIVGAKYKPDQGLLVYASAENFTWMTRAAAPARFTDDRAWNRYRACYEEHCSDKTFFPNVGIQPVTDGGLFAAAMFVSMRLGLAVAGQPRDFLECVAFSNWGKFTVKSRDSARNEDYAGAEDKLGESLSFVVTELVVLQPKVVLVPKSIWRQRLLQAAMRGAAPFTRFLPVPQFNATVVNCTLGQYSTSAKRLRKKFEAEPLGEWMRNLYGFREENAWRYVALLDELLDIKTDSSTGPS